MLLLHVSDIHFKAPQCSNPDHDPTRPYRTRLVQSVGDKVNDLGPVDAILVGGDIAFKGDPAEYDAAAIWLKELADAAGNADAPIFVVPGNHDVDQRIIQNRLSVQNAQAAIHQATDNQREAVLAAQLRDIDAGLALFMPLTAYNEFAAVLNCQVYAPEKVFWSKTLDLGEGVQLRIFGLTSTILSGLGAPAGRKDNRETMFLGALQTVLDPIDDVVNLVICHHPPEWLRDEERVTDQINGRAAIQLFGHKHAGRISREVDYLRIGAGAVNPDEYEQQWRPTFNFLNLNVEGNGTGRMLVTETHIMEWQTNPEGYFARRSQLNEPWFRHSINIPERQKKPPKSSKLPIVQTVAVDNAGSMEPTLVEVEAAMTSPNTRNIIDRFWKLTSSQRRQIATKLHLLDEGEISLPEPVRYGRALQRAGAREQLADLEKEITTNEHN